MADSTELVCLSVVICLQKVTVRSSQTQSVGTRPQSSASTRFPELSRIPSQASTYAPPVPQFRSVWAPLPPPPPPPPPPPTSSTSTSTQPTISRKRTIGDWVRGWCSRKGDRSADRSHDGSTQEAQDEAEVVAVIFRCIIEQGVSYHLR